MDLLEEALRRDFHQHTLRRRRYIPEVAPPQKFVSIAQSPRPEIGESKRWVETNSGKQFS